jgi:hypothetical protein
METNAIQVGQFSIVLEKEQLSYYSDGRLCKVADVNHEFTNKDLFSLGERISEKYGYGEVKFILKDSIRFQK